MGSFLSAALHRIPPITTNSGTIAEHDRAAYRAVIDRTSPARLAEALVDDRDFDVSGFGVDDDDFHDGCSVAIAAVRTNPLAIAAAREHLYTVVESHVVRDCRHRTDVQVGGMWVAIYGGLSCGDEPFEGFGGVCALSTLSDLSVELTPGIPVGLHDDVRGSITDEANPGAVVQWAAENPHCVDAMVTDEIDNRESVIVDVVDSATSDIRADIRDAVVERIKSTLGVVDD